MIKTIADKRIDWLVNHIVNDDSLMQLKPVLAGGSMLSVYRAYRLYDSSEKWQLLERAATFFKDHNNSSKSYLFNNKLEPFGDIDAWFLKDSDLHSDGFASWLIKDLAGKNESFHDLSLPEPLGKRYRLTRSSSWANSFCKEGHARNNFVFQVIKKPISSPKDLFASFDFVNCCVGYYDGTLYYDSDLDDAFSNFSLKMNNTANYERDCPMSQRVYAALRAFKYSKRYLLDFSPDLSELIYQLYVDIESIDYSQYENHITLVNDTYGSVRMATNDFRDMVKTLESKFKDFSKMKTFRKDYALFLLNRTKLAGLEEYFGAKAPKLSRYTPF